MKTIIIATDYSPAAGNALAYGARLARHCGAGVVLFNAYHLPVPVGVGDAMLPLPDKEELIAENIVVPI